MCLGARGEHPTRFIAGWRRCLIRPTGSQSYIIRHDFVGLISAAPSGKFLEQGSSTLPALLPDGGVPPYPAYGIAVMHYPARFCRPDKRSANRHVFGSQGRTSCPLYCRMAALPYPAYGIVLFCRPDKRSAIRHVLGARIEHPANFIAGWRRCLIRPTDRIPLSIIRVFFCNIYKCFAITRVSRRTR